MVNARAASTAVTSGLTTLSAEVQKTREELGGRLTVLERFVFGSDPPPRPGSMPDDGWIDAQAAKRDSNAVVPMLARIEQKTDKQSEAMGIGIAGIAWLTKTREGRAVAAGLASVLVAAGAWVAAAVRPSTAPPAARVEVVRIEGPVSIPDASTAPLNSR